MERNRGGDAMRSFFKNSGKRIEGGRRGGKEQRLHLPMQNQVTRRRALPNRDGRLVYTKSLMATAGRDRNTKILWMRLIHSTVRHPCHLRLRARVREGASRMGTVAGVLQAPKITLDFTSRTSVGDRKQNHRQHGR